MSLNFETSRGKYREDSEGREVLYIDWRQRRNSDYDISVFRARREAGDTVSCHRFVGHFNVKASNDFDFESYNLSAKNDNEFKEEDMCLKECRIGPKFNPNWGRKQLVLMVAEYKILNYEAMAKNGECPLRVWEKYLPNCENLAFGASYFHFNDDYVEFFLRNQEKEVIEQKVFRREDSLLRGLVGTLKPFGTTKLLRDYQAGLEKAQTREILNNYTSEDDEFWYNTAAELEEKFGSPGVLESEDSQGEVRMVANEMNLDGAGAEVDCADGDVEDVVTDMGGPADLLNELRASEQTVHANFYNNFGVLFDENDIPQ